jgi:hypothetical protein
MVQTKHLAISLRETEQSDDPGRKRKDVFSGDYVSGVQQGRLDVFGLQPRIVVGNLRSRDALGNRTNHTLDGNARAADHWLSGHYLGVKRNTLEQWIGIHCLAHLAGTIPKRAPTSIAVQDGLFVV